MTETTRRSTTKYSCYKLLHVQTQMQSKLKCCKKKRPLSSFNECHFC